MKFSNEIIGARLLEVITSGLYAGNLNCIREYVQNSIDSGAKNIDIKLENGKNLQISDNGEGMDRDELYNSLTIGKSKKTKDQIGWRGIGIWSGVSACDRLIIITKKKNNPKYRIIIDNNLIRTSFENDENFLLTVLDNATTDIEECELGNDDSLKDSHYTIIRLESIDNSQQEFFSETNIRRYLEKTVPSPLNPDKFDLKTKIDNYLEKLNVKFPNVEIRFNNYTIYRVPHSSNIFYQEIIPYEFKIDDRIIAIGWFLCTKNKAKLNPPNSGIYFKKKGMTLGDENLIRKCYDISYNEWQFGEIHILSDTIRENAARDDFEYNSEDLHLFKKDLKSWMSKLQQLNHNISDRIHFKKLGDISKEFEKGQVKNASIKLMAVKGKIVNYRKVPDSDAFSQISIEIEKDVNTQNNQIAEIERKIKDSPENTKKQRIEEAKYELDKTIKNLPIEVRKDVEKLKGKGKLEPVIAISDSLERILRDKTGFSKQEYKFINLTKEAYGWKDLSYNNKDTNSKLKLTENKWKNALFGVMLYGFYDLIINQYKHEKGLESLKWIEDADEEERYKIINEILCSIGLLYRLVDHSKPNK